MKIVSTSGCVHRDVKHWHTDRRNSDGQCRLSSACVACDIIADSHGMLPYDLFPFANKADPRD